MYVLNKIVWNLANPLFVGLLMLVVALLFSRRFFGRLCVFLSLLWFAFWMMPATGDYLGATLEESYLVDGAIPSVESYPEADVILVLGGGMAPSREPDGGWHAEMNSNSDRVWMGARLFKAEKAPKIALTSNHVAESTVPLLTEMGVDPSRIEIHDEPRNTEEEARLLATNGVKKVLLVTSAWHMRRSELMFRRYAPEVEIIPAPTDWEYTVRRRVGEEAVGCERIGRYLPDAEACWRNLIAFKEWLGYYGYRYLRK